MVRLALGRNGSGLVFHMHDLAINALAAGRKRWFVFNNKERSFFSCQRSYYSCLGFVMRSKGGRPLSMRQWLHTVYPRAAFQATWRRRGWECVQAAGEVFFVPGLLQHGVVNIGETLAVAVTATNVL